MHVFLVAEELAIPRVIVPRFPGHLSALGQLLADRRHDFVRAWGGPLVRLDANALRGQAADMRDEAAAALAADGFGPDRQVHDVTVDMRYVGQSYSLGVPLDPDAPDLAALKAEFDDRHTRTFGVADPRSDCEIVAIRLVANGVVDRPVLAFRREREGDPLLEIRPVWFGDGWTDCRVYDRACMAPGFVIDGPAVIEEAGGTSVVPPGWRIEVHDSGTLDCRFDGAR